MAHNGQGSIPWESPALKDSADLYLLPQPDPNSSPACLDGSPYGPYFRKSPTNSTKWTVWPENIMRGRCGRASPQVTGSWPDMIRE